MKNNLTIRSAPEVQFQSARIVKSTTEIKTIFDSISRRYDLLNSILSFGQQGKWRQRFVESALKGSELSILDLGVGPGRSLNDFLRRKSFERAVGCDFSDKMLERAKQFLPRKTMLVACDFHRLPFEDNSFDLAVGSFILRSVQDLPDFFKGVYRVLRPGGRAAFLELTKPENLLFYRLLYRPYLGLVIPVVGQLLGGNKDAYRFLGMSIQRFVTAQGLQEHLERAGFRPVSLQVFNFGAVSIIVTKKE